jgi:hypothetical protein
MIWYERKSCTPSSHRLSCMDDGFSFVVRFDSEFVDETRSQSRQSITLSLTGNGSPVLPVTIGALPLCHSVTARTRAIWAFR